jgi:hypothetical protein
MALAILSSVPVITFGVAQVATSGNAWASTATSCTGTGPGQPITFGGPGISDLGAAQVSKKTTSTTGAGTIMCTGKKTGAGTVSASTIKTKSKETCAEDSNPPSPCPATDYVVDSISQFISGASTLWKDAKTESFAIGSSDFIVTLSSSGTASCPSPEQGFTLTGTLTTAPGKFEGKSVTITACLGADSGPHTTGSFGADAVSEFEGNTSILIQTANLDPANSTIAIA